jgi:hypothetical protein
MANEIFKAPAGFLVGTGEGAQVLLGGLAVQFKLRAGADGRAAEHHGDDAGPASPGAAARPRRRG